MPSTVPSANDLTRSPAWQSAMARSLVYAFLCRAFAYPNADHRAALRERIAPALGEFADDGETGQALREALLGVDGPIEELREAHTAIFTLTVSADCPEYETAYHPGDIFQQTQVMADVAGFYRAHGLEAGGPQPERPDHITTELEFMSFLALKEAYAIDKLGKDEVGMTREAQSLFLRDHLGCWGPAFGRRVQARAGDDSSFYAAVGRLLTCWLIDECDRLRVVPVQAMAEPRLEWPEPDDGACGAEGDGQIINFDEIPVI